MVVFSHLDRGNFECRSTFVSDSTYYSYLHNLSITINKSERLVFLIFHYHINKSERLVF